MGGLRNPAERESGLALGSDTSMETKCSNTLRVALMGGQARVALALQRGTTLLNSTALSVALTGGQSRVALALQRGLLAPLYSVAFNRSTTLGVALWVGSPG